MEIKKQTIFTSIVLGLCVVLASMLVLNYSKVKAAEDILQAKARIAELDILIKESQDEYKVADEAETECVYSCRESWWAVKDRVHNNADLYRMEQQELEGFLMQR